MKNTDKIDKKEIVLREVRAPKGRKIDTETKTDNKTLNKYFKSNFTILVKN